MVQRLGWVVLVLADDDVCNALLVVPRYGLGNPTHFSGDEEGQFESHGVVGEIKHVCMPDGEFDLGSH